MQIKEKWRDELFFLIIVLQPILDVIAYVQYDNLIGSFAGYVRLFFMVALAVVCFFISRERKKYMLFFSVLGLFCILHVVNGLRVGYISIFQDVAYMARVAQVPILTVCFITLMRSHSIKYIKAGCSVNLFFIAVIICLSAITDTNPYTYVDDQVGLRGWFGNANSQSIVVASLVPMTMAFAMGLRKIWILFLVSVLSSFVLLTNGTKGCYYSLVLIAAGYIGYTVLYALVNARRDRFDIAVIGVMAMCVAAAVFYYPYSARCYMDTRKIEADEKWNSEVEKKLTKLETEREKFDVNNPETVRALIEMYENDMDEGLVKRWGAERVLKAYGYTPTASELADNRRVKRMYASFVWEESDFLTRLVGFEFSRIESYDLENDFPALAYYYGYIGFGLYLLFLLYFLFILCQKAILDFKEVFVLDNFALLMSLVLLMGLAQYSGALLRRPNASIYLSLFLACIYSAVKKQKGKGVSEKEN